VAAAVPGGSAAGPAARAAPGAAPGAAGHAPQPTNSEQGAQRGAGSGSGGRGGPGGGGGSDRATASSSGGSGGRGGGRDDPEFEPSSGELRSSRLRGGRPQRARRPSLKARHALSPQRGAASCRKHDDARVCTSGCAVPAQPSVRLACTRMPTVPGPRRSPAKLVLLQVAARA